MSKKTALVTGSNRGIGKEILRQLGKLGFTVIMTTRFSEKGIDAIKSLREEGIDVHFVQLDVTDQSSIDEAYKQIKSQFGRLDVLVNNAGILIDGSDSILEIPSSKIFLTLHTNATSTIMVTRTLLPLMTSDSRIIMISSGGGSITNGISTWAPIYCISKTTMNAVTMQLSHALKDRGIPVNAVSPGWVRTDMGGAAAERSVEKGAETPVWLATEAPKEINGQFLMDKKVVPW